MATRRKTDLAVADEIEVVVEPAPARASKVRARPQARRRGRPADSDGLTRERILAAARECFAESGYAVASTHTVASRVGLTTGALYHHFGSKRELYLAVLEEVEQLVYDRFQEAAGPHDSFVAQFEALLDEAVRLNTADPSLAGFIQSVTGDLARHPDLVEALESAWARRDSFFSKMVDAGIASGELAAADRDVVLDTVTTMITGVIVVANGLPVAQTRAVEGIKRMLTGRLLAS